MKRVKRRIFYGALCDQEVYIVGEQKEIKKNMRVRPRFQSEEERAQHREHIARVRHHRKFMATYGPQSLYSTLTFDRENEVHTVWEAELIRVNFMRCLKRLNPAAQLSIYMGFGKKNRRIHFHMVSNGISEEQIREKWKYGSNLRIEHLREHNFYNGEDRGQDYTGLANYLFDHWTPEIGGHRYHTTRNLNEPQKEDPMEAVQVYTVDKPPRAPKGYKLVEVKSTKYGYQLFKYVWDIEKKPLEQLRKRRGG